MGDNRETRIRRIHEHAVFSNAFVRVFNDDVVFPDGDIKQHVRVLPGDDKMPVVLVIEFIGKIAIIQSYHYPVGQTIWAFPRGFGHNEDPLRTAAAELVEEVGGSCENLRVIGHVYPDSGLLGTKVAVVTGILSAPPRQPSDTKEILRVSWLDSVELRAWIANGTIEDGITLSAWAMAVNKGYIRVSA